MLQIRPVDDVSESIFADGWVDGRTGVAGNEVGGIVEQVNIYQVQASAKHVHNTHNLRGFIVGGDY